LGHFINTNDTSTKIKSSISTTGQTWRTRTRITRQDWNKSLPGVRSGTLWGSGSLGRARLIRKTWGDNWTPDTRLTGHDTQRCLNEWWYSTGRSPAPAASAATGVIRNRLDARGEQNDVSRLGDCAIKRVGSRDF